MGVERRVGPRGLGPPGGSVESSERHRETNRHSSKKHRHAVRRSDGARKENRRSERQEERHGGSGSYRQVDAKDQRHAGWPYGQNLDGRIQPNGRESSGAGSCRRGIGRNGEEYNERRVGSFFVIVVQEQQGFER